MKHTAFVFFTDFLNILKKLAKNVTVEPVMLLYSFSFSSISVYVEDLQMRRICEVNLDNDPYTCSNLPNATDLSSKVQEEFSVFAFYDGIIKSAIPLFFILFVGAWSDKYGRKVPLFIALLGQVCMMLGLFISSFFEKWPVEYLLVPTLMDSMGGGNVCFLTAVNAYISDVSDEASRTTRLSWANSIFFLGGPTGTFASKYLYEFGGYKSVFGTSFGFSFIALMYVMCCIQESHGPYTSKRNLIKSAPKKLGISSSLVQVYGLESEKNTKETLIRREDITLTKMVTDFFNPQRIIDSFRSTIQAREGNTRSLILLVIFSSLLRRLSRSPYVFAFTRHALSWETGDYSLWVTFKNMMSTIGSLFLVPLLSGRLHVTDHFLGIIGAFSSFMEYFLYGIVVFIGEIFFWIAPICGLLVNSCTIAQRSMLSKYVTSDELGKVSAVLGALDGVMPMVTYALYMAIYRQTVSTFPAAHFFLGTAVSAAMAVIFLIIKMLERTKKYDIEKAVVLDPKTPVISKEFNWIRTNSLLHSSNVMDMSTGLPTKRSNLRKEKGKDNAAYVTSENSPKDTDENEFSTTSSDTQLAAS